MLIKQNASSKASQKMANKGPNFSTNITSPPGGLKETYIFLQGLQVERLERISVDYLLIGTVFLLNAQSFSLLLLFSSSFWYLFNFCRHSHGNLLKWHASFSGDYDQGELHYSAGPHRRLCQPKLTHTKTNSKGIWREKKRWWMDWKGQNWDMEEIPSSGWNMSSYILNSDLLQASN